MKQEAIISPINVCMKKVLGLFLFNAILLSAQAQTNNNVIRITGTKFPFDIMQKWIDLYSQTHPGIQFRLSKAIPTDSADLLIAAHSFREGELNKDQVKIAVNRYAQLPVVNSNRADLKALQEKGFTKEDLQDIYFRQSQQKSDIFHTAANVYRRDKNVCASRSFAENVTGVQSDVAGTLVNGDDKVLLNAVKQDVNGISYNNLGLIYNLQTRQVADSIAVVPIDLNENGKIDPNENIYGNLDVVLNYLVKTKDKTIPQDDVNIVINKKTISKNALQFVSWIVSQGQQYNRSYGFLDLDKVAADKDQQLVQELMQEQAADK